ncbi:amino acid ABC transporter permease [Sporolactobacillus laevolacticus]|uniref:amino acid ABC transporter permease n=1 Tax=Sporolactobacillus laevolacticus TaxID=33018 RepID=UPI00042043FE|nr:amino acid ABC transporter permease [Sporolactobacillus laevolacticus]
MDFFKLFEASLPALLAGLVLTLKIISVGIIVAVIIGLVLGIINVGHNKILKLIAKLYIDLVRGTPLLVQVFFIYFGLPSVLNFKLDAMLAGIIAIGINASAYISEIIRAGIKSIDSGQMEAARSLGLPYGVSMRKVILPQAFKRMIPPLVNQFIISLKDTSILSSIGVIELTSSGQIIIASSFKAFQVWIMVGILYFMVIEILTLLSSRLERWVS